MLYFLKKIFFVVFLPFVLVKSSYAQSESLNIEHLMESVAEIWIANTWPREQPTQASQSSGFFITENLLVATYHSLAEGLAKGNPIGIRTSSTVDSGFVVVSEPSSDLVIIKTLKNHYRPVTLGQAADIHKGDNIFTIGSPQAELGTVYEGILLSKIGSRLGSEVLFTTIPSLSGSSGSPIFSRDLETVVGIHWGKTREDDLVHIEEGTNTVISVNKLRIFIKRNKEVLERATGMKIGRSLYFRVRESKRSYDFYKKRIELCTLY